MKAHNITEEELPVEYEIPTVLSLMADTKVIDLMVMAYEETKLLSETKTHYTFEDCKKMVISYFKKYGEESLGRFTGQKSNEFPAVKKTNLSGNKWVGIVYAIDWYNGYLPVMTMAKDFVVGEWSDFHDGEKSHIEGKTTIAVCKNKEDAVLILESKKISLK